MGLIKNIELLGYYLLPILLLSFRLSFFQENRGAGKKSAWCYLKHGDILSICMLCLFRILLCSFLLVYCYQSFLNKSKAVGNVC